MPYLSPSCELMVYSAAEFFYVGGLHRLAVQDLVEEIDPDERDNRFFNLVQKRWKQKILRASGNLDSGLL